MALGGVAPLARMLASYSSKKRTASPRSTRRPLKIQGSAKAACPTMTAAQAVCVRMRSRSSNSSMPPLPQTGIETAFTARAMRDQSTGLR